MTGAPEPPGQRSARRWAHWLLLPAMLAVGLVAGAVAFRSWPDAVVVVESIPSGAEVTLDGKVVGRTPLRLVTRPLPLRGEVGLSLPGYRAWSGTLTANPGETRRLETQLQPLAGSLAVGSSPPGATVSANGRTLGTTPLLADLPPGRYEIELSLARFTARRQPVEITAGARSSLDLTLAPASGATPVAPPTPIAQAQPTPPPGPARRDPNRPIYPVAVMVENAVDARPQDGLAAADLVFEALVEGGITRFMAVYADGDAPTVGPVRSARHYFVNLASELGAALVHVGASPQGYQSLRAANLADLDETYGHPGFWRSSARYAPHNAYTSVAGARAALAERGPLARGGWGGLEFAEAAGGHHGPPATELTIDYRPQGYRVGYRFDPASGLNARSMDGLAHLDASSGAQIRAANVAVLTVPSQVIDGEGRLELAQVGAGAARYFVDGVVLEGSWQKASRTDNTRYLDRSGSPIRFNPGSIWVQIIPTEGKVMY